VGAGLESKESYMNITPRWPMSITPSAAPLPRPYTHPVARTVLDDHGAVIEAKTLTRGEATDQLGRIIVERLMSGAYLDVTLSEADCIVVFTKTPSYTR